MFCQGAIGIALPSTSERKTAQSGCQGLAETSSSFLEASFGLLPSFWPLSLFSPLLRPLDYHERMYPTPHPHVCFDGAAAGEGVWIPSRRTDQTSKLPQSADGGLLLRHPRLCSQSERVDRYYNCYLAADILRDRTWHLERVGFRPLTAQVERTEPRDWRTISYLHHGFAMRRTIGQTDSNCFGELRSFSLALKLPFCDSFWREGDYSSLLDCELILSDPW